MSVAADVCMNRLIEGLLDELEEALALVVAADGPAEMGMIAERCRRAETLARAGRLLAAGFIPEAAQR